MTKSKDGFLGVSRLALSGLRNWTTAALPSAVFAARHFRPFLPPRGQVELGEPWWIIPSELSVFTGYLSNNRFYPPPPKGKEVIIHRLLSMFHPRPFVKTRFAPQGAVACLTAISDFYYTVMFRIHAEFQLSEPPDFPFWFSPGQFTGHIILSKDATHVRDFRLFVPNHRSLNVDMEWLYGASENSNMEVDIGYIPQMELEALGPSVPSVILDEDGNMIDSRPPSGEPLQFVFEEIKWQQELSWEEAARRLEVAMYPFKKVGRSEGEGRALCGQGWGSSRWVLVSRLGTGPAAEATSLQGLARGFSFLSLAIQNLEEAFPWLSNTLSRTHTHTTNTRTHTHYTELLNRTLASHSSFSLSPLGLRSPICHSPRPSTKPRPRTSWCTQFFCGGPWMTSPAEVRETLPVWGRYHTSWGTGGSETSRTVLLEHSGGGGGGDLGTTQGRGVGEGLGRRGCVPSSEEAAVRSKRGPAWSFSAWRPWPNDFPSLFFFFFFFFNERETFLRPQGLGALAGGHPAGKGRAVGEALFDLLHYQVHVMV
uniref:Selenoprotein N n=1 Tax=Lynx canadensis TaxID=61383 RepID=A0A667H2T5_LYNCA